MYRNLLSCSAFVLFENYFKIGFLNEGEQISPQG